MLYNQMILYLIKELISQKSVVFINLESVTLSHFVDSFIFAPARAGTHKGPSAT